jgi:phosphatidylethanolamine-binding protein (PEBP) family uncharacterized protein
MLAMQRRQLYAALAVLLLAGGAMSHAQSKFNVDFTWEGTAKCFDPKSPPFSVSGVPAGAKVLRFAMKDLDAPNFPHGGGAVPYSGETRIERGAFAYKGPCPPQGQHRYEWTVEAEDSTGKTLATATVTKKFPPG